MDIISGGPVELSQLTGATGHQAAGVADYLTNPVN